MSAEKSQGSTDATQQAAAPQAAETPKRPPQLPPERRPNYILVMCALLKRAAKAADLERACLLATDGTNGQWLGAVTMLLSRGYLEFANPDRESDGFLISSRGRVEAENLREYAKISEELKRASPPPAKRPE